MRKVFKYQLRITEQQTLNLPVGAEILSVGNQEEKLVLWAMVNPDTEVRPVDVRIVGTGHEITFPWQAFKFVGTVLMHAGDLVWHVWVQK